MKSDIYWIAGPWPGRLAIIARPRGGDWLEDDVGAWKQAGLNVIVSLLVADEESEFELVDEGKLSRAAGMTFLSFPIVDRSIPESRIGTLGLLKQLHSALSEGKNVGIHCRQGIGRSALIAASLLVISGIPADNAMELVSTARGRSTPETPEQREWVKRLDSFISASELRGIQTTG